MTATTATPRTGRRVRRVLIFLMVVWSLGAAFLGLQAGLISLLDYGFSAGLPATMAIPKQSQAAVAHCKEVVSALPLSPPDPQLAMKAPYLAWQLGNVVGFADGLLSAQAARREQIAGLIQPSVALSRALAVPQPALPEHQSSAFALREFTLFLADDHQCVAAALDSRHSARHAALYKFGAVVGFASVYRRLAPAVGAVFGPEIEAYGSAAGLPREVWGPWLEKSMPAPQGSDAREAVPAALRYLNEYIRNTH